MKNNKNKSQLTNKKKIVKISKEIIKDLSFPIVGMGASAGGLDAFENFFRHVPADSRIAFVLIQHLDPTHSSMLTEILQRITSIPVVEALNNVKIVPNHIYVIPPNRDIGIFHGTLHLSIPENPRGQRMPIDFFFRTLAEEQGEMSIGIILSGTGSDGTLGLRAIHGAGGVSFIQEPSSAKYDGMPTSAIRSGHATYVLPVENIPVQLIAYTKTLFGQKIKPVTTFPTETNTLFKILMAIRSKTGHDFSLYKKSTINRRIERRMSVHNIEDMNFYARFLKEHQNEIQILFKELLINVTSFFREPEAFEVLKNNILPNIFKDKPENYTFRIWITGCATGEEAYSIAIIFREFMEEKGQDFKVQIYSTDLDDDLIIIARAAIYQENISIDVSPERLKKFFIKEENGYRVRKDIRDMIIFAVQDVIKDPPFTKLDILSCRNLLIYLEPELQNRLIPVFHYALKPGGILFLSPSESIGNHLELFSSLDKKWKLFRSKSSIASTHTVTAPALAWTRDRAVKTPDDTVIKNKEINYAELTKKILLQSYAPPSVITDEKGNILYIYGDTGKYLKPPPGKPSLNIVDMAREGLQLELKAAIHRVISKKTKVNCKNLNIKTNGGFKKINFTVKSLRDSGLIQNLLLITFEDVKLEIIEKVKNFKLPIKKGQIKLIKELEQELKYTKENLNTSIEELQANNEELKSTNEELQSTNEELQSTNEELETSKEELQSLNEELITVNAELQSKIEQLAGIQNDMKNLLDNTNIGIIFLDEQLSIKLFNREATKIFHLVSTDIDRQLSDIKSNIIDEDILENAQRVLDTLIPFEKELITKEYEWFLSHILPYRTLDNIIAGIVITFTDITLLKKAEEANMKAREFAENIVDTIIEPLLILDRNLKVVSAGKSFYKTFKVTPEETIGKYIFDLGNKQWDISKLRELLETIIPQNTFFENMEVEHIFPIIGYKKMVLNARRITGQNDETQLILLAFEVVKSFN